MESKKSIAKNRKSLFTYIQELKDELKKVSWTTLEELRFSTKMVVLATVFFGLGIYLVDFFIKSSLDSIRAVLHFIFG
ncbi:MAG: preprotein translocase subunit SecE [Chlamydiota bacterium]